MRIEIAGAQITDTVVEVLDTLQNQRDLTNIYISTIDELTRLVILDTSGDEDQDSPTLALLRSLQMIRKDLLTLSMPPDVDNFNNDIPSISL